MIAPQITPLISSTSAREKAIPSSESRNTNPPNIDIVEVPRIHCDHVSALVICKEDNSYFLTLVQPSSTYTLLGIQLVHVGDSWKKTIESFFHNAGLKSVKSDGIIYMDRWCVPGIDKMPSHAVYKVSVEHQLKKTISEKFPGAWLTFSEIEGAQQNRKLFSPSIFDIIRNLNQNINQSMIGGDELIYKTLFCCLETNKTRKTGFEQVVHSAKFGKEEQELLYKEFLHYMCPFTQMGYTSFVTFMKALSWPESTIRDLFRAFDLSNIGGLTFLEFLYGLASIQPNTEHGGPPAEIRCRYIFRFYDQNNDSKLTIDEFKSMLIDIHKIKGRPTEQETVEQETERCFKLFGDVTTNAFLLSSFLSAVGQLHLRGTSLLLRSPTSLPIYLKTRRLDDATVQIKTKSSRTYVDSMSLTDGSGNFETGPTTIKPKYDLAAHSVRVRKSGTILDVHSIQDTEHGGLVNGGHSSELTPREFKIGEEARRVISFNRFNPENQPNEMLNGLKFFEKQIMQNKMEIKPAFEWGEVDKLSLARCLINLCQQAREILKNESRLLEIPSPCYILGDLHGNFPDLLCFQRALWRLGPLLTPASFLFLGDYVDRGIYSVEVISYLFAQKILSPLKFNLLRGNHEIREVQQMFTFFRECILKFGDALGHEVWEEVNLTFDVMPLAAIVDGNIFCVHGGIPPPWIGDGLVNVINTIPCPLPEPETTSSLAWELMWSDPEHVEDALSGEKSKVSTNNQGFSVNSRRGTGHVFSEQALDTFLSKNGLSHVVRAHEVQQCGFQVHHGGKLLTVFSSSKYCGGSNEAACILADKNKLRSIRIDTS